MRPLTRTIVICGILCDTSFVRAQISVADPYKGGYSSRAKELAANEAKLVIALKMDRAQYFTGEIAEVTITASNPTVSLLEIREPLDPAGPALDLMSRDPKWVPIYGSEWGFRAPHPRAIFNPKHPNPPAVFLAAGHGVERRFKSNAKYAANQQPIFRVPDLPGDYRLAYTYAQNNRATAEFRVIRLRVLAHSVLISPRTEPYFEERYKRTVQGKRYAFLFAFEGDGAYWVVVTLHTGRTDPQLIIDKDGYFPLGAVRRDFIRVARSTVPIVSVRGSLDAAENLSIGWTDQSGKISTIDLDSDRKPRGTAQPLP